MVVKKEDHGEFTIPLTFGVYQFTKELLSYGQV